MESHLVLASVVRQSPNVVSKNSSSLSSEPRAFPTNTVSEQYYLPRHVYACSLSGGLVFVDLLRNRYFSIGETETRAIGPHIANHAIAGNSWDGSVAASESIAARLLQAGLLQQQESGLRDFTPADVHGAAALLSIEDVYRASMPASDYLLSFALSCLWARVSLRTRPLHAIACSLKRAKAQRASPNFDSEKVASLVSAFRRLRPFAFTSLDRCLFHALALTRFLNHHGQFPTWVIGVRLRPWGAHSWVQHNQWVLDTTPEIVREYVPLLAV